MIATVRITFVVAGLLVLATAVHAGVRAQMEVQGDGISSTILLDHPFLNGNANALIMVSQAGWEDPGSINVFYSGAWRLSNNSASPIPATATFWILAFDGDSGFRHTTNAGNIVLNWTVLDDSRLNGNPGAHPIVTRETTNGPAIPWPLGVWYNTSSARWNVFFQDTTQLMPENASFSIFIPAGRDWSFTHTATAGNVNANYTVLDNPDIDQTASHRIFASQRWEGVYNNAYIGIGWFLSYLIGNVGGEPMPVDAKFNVFIAPIFEDGFELGSTVLWSSTSP